MPTPSTQTGGELLRPDNHDLFVHVRLRLIARNPAISWEEIADEVAIENVNELIAWFASYRLPPPPRARVLPAGLSAPRDPTDRAEYLRLRDREASLLTVVSEAPMRLAAVQIRMSELEVQQRRAPGHRYH